MGGFAATLCPVLRLSPHPLMPRRAALICHIDHAPLRFTTPSQIDPAPSDGPHPLRLTAPPQIDHTPSD
uniref:Uncharacterized protein n=1 Tax=Knipowitschia caucasica TaxID=637954 RepID=A0AAV2KX27_KNICA